MDGSRRLSPGVFVLLGAVVSVAVAWMAWLYFAADLPSIDGRYLSAEAFDQQYGTRIYRYRVLSRGMLAAVEPGLRGLEGPAFGSRWSPFLGALFVVNVVFLGLTTWQLLHMIYRSRFLAVRRRALAFLLLTAVVTVAGVTVNAYDFVAYWLLLGAVWFSFVYLERPSRGMLAWVVVSTALATFNRETAALGVALFAALQVTRYGLRWRSLRPIAIVTAAFVLPYVGLRLWLGWGSATHNHSELVRNFTEPIGLLGILVWIAATAACMRWAHSRDNRRLVVLFNLAAAPYWAMCLYAGRMEELRLFVPLLLIDFWLAVRRAQNDGSSPPSTPRSASSSSGLGWSSPSSSAFLRRIRSRSASRRASRASCCSDSAYSCLAARRRTRACLRNAPWHSDRGKAPLAGRGRLQLANRGRPAPRSDSDQKQNAIARPCGVAPLAATTEGTLPDSERTSHASPPRRVANTRANANAMISLRHVFGPSSGSGMIRVTCSRDA